MATGVLFSGTVFAGAGAVLVYTPPTAKVGTINISVTSADAFSTAVNIETNFTNIEFNTLLPPYGTLERGGLVLRQGDTLRVLTTLENVSVTVYGYEE